MNKEEMEKIIKSNSNYWQRRSLNSKLNAITNEEDYIRRLEAFYNTATKQIDEKLAKLYARYAKENKITLKEAYSILPKAMEKEYKNDVFDYIKKAKSKNNQYYNYLLNQSILHKHKVLDQLRTEIRNVVYNIDIKNTQGKFLSKIFQNSNYEMQHTGNELFAKVDENKVKQIIEQNWSGNGSFSETIWKNKDKLVKSLDDIMIRGIATGESYDKLSTKLSKRMETSKNNAKRLIVTEAARMSTEGSLAYYKESGVKELINIATLDMRTSDICMHMDGTIVPIEEAKIGLNIPPFHPYCRTVISPHYEDNEPSDRVYRDITDGKTKSGRYRTYKDYLIEELKDKKKAKALASNKNDILTLTMATSNIDNTINRKSKDFIQTDYETINHCLRNGYSLTKKKKETVRKIDEMLEQLPNYDGDLMRALNVQNLDEFLDQYQIGDIKNFKEYFFANLGSDIKTECNVIFSIKSKNAKDIRQLKGNQNMDAIFKRDSNFQIIKINYDKTKNILFIDMEELI